MISVIKTAIITILISFISGVLLDNYKNLAPRISCTMGKCVSVKLKNKKIMAYILKVKNISNKTIHDLTINVQRDLSDFKMDDAKITGGLKFNINDENDNFNVSIPFLSKNDEFSVKLFLDNAQGSCNKPVVTLRSPENFKEIRSKGSNGLISSLFTISQEKDKHRKGSYKSEAKSFENRILNKSILMTTASIFLVVCVIFLGKGLYKSVTVKSKIEDVKSSDIQQKSGTQDNSLSKSSSDNKSNTEKIEGATTKIPSKENNNNEVKSSKDSSNDSSKTSDDKTTKNPETNQNSSIENTNENKETENEKNYNDSSSDTKKEVTNSGQTDNEINKNINTSQSTSTNNDSIQEKQSNTSSQNQSNGTSTTEKQQPVSNTESGKN